MGPEASAGLPSAEEERNARVLETETEARLARQLDELQERLAAERAQLSAVHDKQLASAESYTRIIRDMESKNAELSVR